MNSVLIRPIITEKTMSETAMGRFAFEVLKSANKPEILAAVRTAFKVNPTHIQTLIVKGKTKRSMRTRKTFRGSDWKKAIVQLKSGEKIDLFDTTEKPNA